MFIVESYSLAIALCFITMICWGSWGNSQKLAAKTWRYELFYWDYVLGIFFFSLFLGLTLGSFGQYGRPFIEDLRQTDISNLVSAFSGGIVFNAGNILLSASIAIAGMAVAFPLGIGIALVLGVFINYISYQKGDPTLLTIGVLLITIAIILNGIAFSKTNKEKSLNKKGIYLSIIAGVLIAYSYKFVVGSMDIENFVNPAIDMMTPYSALFVCAIGILSSNFVFNTFVMKHPITGIPVTYKEYFKGRISTHMVGVLGGLIWGLGTGCSYLASNQAGTAISYGLGQGATMVAALWGVFVWKEFKGANKQVNILLAAMFVLFTIGLIFIILAGS